MDVIFTDSERLDSSPDHLNTGWCDQMRSILINNYEVISIPGEPAQTVVESSTAETVLDNASEFIGKIWLLLLLFKYF